MATSNHQTPSPAAVVVGAKRRLQLLPSLSPPAFRRRRRREMAAITSALIAIAGVVLGWVAIEIACKPCLESGREALDRSLNPDYDPDDEENNVGARAPLISNPKDSDPTAMGSPSAPTAVDKAT